MRGVGKTQAVGAYARQRIADKWRLIAWVHAESSAAILDGLSQATARLGISVQGDGQADAARALRHWLEADGERCLVVFDNAASPDELRPYLPTTGGAQIIVTSTHRAIARMGTDIRAGVFTESETLAYLAARTGLPGSEGARELAAELGCLPLALAQAAAVINAQRLSYQTYLDRLRAFHIAGYLIRPAEDPYPHAVAAAILLARQAAQESDLTGMAAPVMDLMSLLSAGGVPRDLFYAAASAGHLTLGDSPAAGPQEPPELIRADRAAQVDAALACLADASMLTFSDDGSTVSSHGLAMRVIREQHARDGTFPAAAATAIASVDAAMTAAEPFWRHPAATRNLIQQVAVLTSHFAEFTGDGDDQSAENLLRLRLSALAWLADLADDHAGTARLGEYLVRDCERVAGHDHPHTLAARTSLGAVYGDTGRLEDAIRLGRETLADCQRVLGRDDTTTLAARMNLAKHYEHAQRLDDAAALAEQALAENERVLGPNDVLTMLARDIAADILLQRGQASAAVALYERNLADAERVLDPGHPGIARFRNNLANAYAQTGNWDKAITLHEQVLARRMQTFGPDHPATLLSRHNVANVYWLAREPAEAIAGFEAVAADRERFLGPDHHDTLVTRAMLAGAKMEAGDLKDAILLAEHTLADQTRVLGAGHPATLVSRNNLATAYMRTGRVDEAITLFEPTASHLERESGPGHPDTLAAQHNLACAYLEAGRLKDAITLNKRALAAATRFLGSDHLDTIKLRAGLAGPTGGPSGLTGPFPCMSWLSVIGSGSSARNIPTPWPHAAVSPWPICRQAEPRRLPSCSRTSWARTIGFWAPVILTR